MIAPRPRKHASNGAFSLIEVLIAVIILALGLLGVGAIIPVVIRAQREASAATSAIVASQDAEAYVRGRRDLLRLTHHLDPNAATGFGVLALDKKWSPTGRWEEWDASDVDTDTGDMILEDPGADVDPSIILAGDRLWPSGGASTPRLVWDMMARRSRPNDPNPNATPPQQGETDAGYVQVALFVRRIDPNIRVPGNLTLRRVLTDPTINASQKRVAVGADAQDNPTFNGTNGAGQRRYAYPLTLQATFDDDERGKIEFTGTANDIALASQIGQKLVDNLGNVYTVVKRDEEDGVSVYITPAVPAWVPDPAKAKPDALFDQVAFTPQVPIAVTVFELTITD